MEIAMRFNKSTANKNYSFPVKDLSNDDEL